MAIKFGTDGWRAVIAGDFTFDNVALCSQGLAEYLKERGQADMGLVVGYDTRFASREFAQRVAEVMAGNGIKAFLCDRPAPTPAVSYNVMTHQSAGAAIITASHNPPNWNGFKFKPEYAGSASPEIIEGLEAHIGEVNGVRSLPLGEAQVRGLVKEVDPDPPYMEQLSRMVDLEAIRSSGLSIVVDSMHGAGAGYLARLLQGAKGPLVEIRGDVNPAFPGMQQPEPISENLAPLSGLVVQSKADVGIAYDGDADRLGVIDEKGQYLNTLQVFALLALYLLEVRGDRGPLVKSLTSSSMLFKLGELYNIPVLETGVGFKFAGPLMMKEDALMAGEESGGYAFRGHIPERDGILSSLLMLEFMVRKGMSPSELLVYLYSKVGEHFYERRDVFFADDQRSQLQKRLDQSAGVKEVGGMRVTAIDNAEGLRFHFDKGWLIVRFSGTEPLVRIYAEADSPQRVQSLLDGASSLLDL